MPSLLSVNVGMPKNVSWRGRTVYTGVWKYPVPGAVMVRRLNIDGDGQGDIIGHGGEQRAVLVYQIQSIRHWQRHLGRDDLGYGRFGENLTVDGLPDDEVCIGDRYRIGRDPAELRLALNIPALSPGWQGSFREPRLPDQCQTRAALPRTAAPGFSRNRPLAARMCRRPRTAHDQHRS